MTIAFFVVKWRGAEVTTLNTQFNHNSLFQSIIHLAIAIRYSDALTTETGDTETEKLSDNKSYSIGR